MPSQVPIEVFRIGHTVVDKDEVARWMQFIGADEFVIPEDEEVSNPALLIALAGKRCYMSFQKSLNKNLTRIRENWVEYFDNILKSGHGSVLEHSVYNFAIENVSRVFTAEMNRHRAGWAISEGSLRFIRFGENIPYWEPTSIQGPNDVCIDVLGEKADTCVMSMMIASELDRDEHNSSFFATELNNVSKEQVLNAKRELSREVFRRAFGAQETAYRVLESIWADELSPESKFKGKKEITSMMRRIIGLGVATGGVWSGNIRALRHVFTMRASAAAEEEMLHVFSRLAKVMVEKEPLLLGDFKQTDEGYWVPDYVKV